jgi:hypothetical protein
MANPIQTLILEERRGPNGAPEHRWAGELADGRQFRCAWLAHGFGTNRGAAQFSLRNALTSQRKGKATGVWTIG